MCSYFNNYDNFNGFSLHSVYIFLKNVPNKCIPYLPGKFAKLWFQSIPYPNILIPLANWTICMLPYYSQQSFFS